MQAHRSQEVDPAEMVETRARMSRLRRFRGKVQRACMDLRRIVIDEEIWNI